MAKLGSGTLNERYYVGIDGGGTKTHLVVLNKDGNLIREAFSGPSSIDTVSFEESFQAIEAALAGSGFAKPISGVFAGIGGIASNLDEEKYETGLRAMRLFAKAKYIEVRNDVYCALASGRGSLQGMALILGTGSVCFGINNHNTWRCGGYHFKEGDAGSAFDVGFHALKYYARVLDGRYPPSSFSDAIKGYLGIDTFSGLVTYFANLNRTEVAKIAPIVTGFGRENQHAYKILLEAAEEVRLLVEGVYRNLEFESATLVVIGGLGTADTLFKELYAASIRRISSLIEIIQPQYSPAMGAALLAREAIERL